MSMSAVWLAFHSGEVSRFYATGAVNGTSCLGGLIGTDSDTVTASFYDQTSGGKGDTIGATQLTTPELELSRVSATAARIARRRC